MSSWYSPASPRRASGTIAEEVGITQRAVQRILAELVAEGVLKVTKHGRRNEYRINRRTRLRHPLEASHRLDKLLDLVS